MNIAGLYVRTRHCALAGVLLLCDVNRLLEETGGFEGWAGVCWRGGRKAPCTGILGKAGRARGAWTGGRHGGNVEGWREGGRTEAETGVMRTKKGAGRDTARHRQDWCGGMRCDGGVCPASGERLWEDGLWIGQAKVQHPGITSVFRRSCLLHGWPGIRRCVSWDRGHCYQQD